MLKIGIISGEHSMDRLKQIELKIGTIVDEKCELIFIPYNEFSELEEKYLLYKSLVDGFVFGGFLPYSYLKKVLTNFDVPVVYLDVEERDFYKFLTELFLTRKDFQLSRTMIDSIYIENNFLGLKDLVSEEEFPYCYSNTNNVDLDNIYPFMLEYHQRLWNENKINLAITGSSNLAKLLNEKGINAIVIYPSIETTLTKFKELIQSIKLLSMKENQIVSGLVKIINSETLFRKDTEKFKLNQLLLNKALIEFNEIHDFPLLIQDNHLDFELLVTYKALQDITSSFKSCKLANYLKKTLPYDFIISWGVSPNLNEARKNALEGLNQFTLRKLVGSSLLMYEGKLIGPLDSPVENTPISHHNKIYEISEFLGISPERVNKLANLQSNPITVQALSQELNISSRTANRIMNVLMEKNAATFVGEEIHGRGRPVKHFQIKVLDLINN